MKPNNIKVTIEIGDKTLVGSGKMVIDCEVLPVPGNLAAGELKLTARNAVTKAVLDCDGPGLLRALADVVEFEEQV